MSGEESLLIHVGRIVADMIQFISLYGTLIAKKAEIDSRLKDLAQEDEKAIIKNELYRHTKLIDTAVSTYLNYVSSLMYSVAKTIRQVDSKLADYITQLIELVNEKGEFDTRLYKKARRFIEEGEKYEKTLIKKLKGGKGKKENPYSSC